jgi:hypothetical protein
MEAVMRKPAAAATSLAWFVAIGGTFGCLRPRKSTVTMSDNSPGNGVSSNWAGSTYSRRSRTARASAARRSSRVQSRAAYSADTNTTTVAACSPYITGSSSARYFPHSSICSSAS